MQIGDYVISNHLNGHRLMWQKGRTRLTYDLDLNALFDSLINEHLDRLINVIRSYDHYDIEQLLDNPDIMALMPHLPQTDLIPGQHFQGEALKQWHYQQFISAYNSFYQTNFQLEHVLAYL